MNHNKNLEHRIATLPPTTEFLAHEGTNKAIKLPWALLVCCGPAMVLQSALLIHYPAPVVRFLGRLAMIAVTQSHGPQGLGLLLCLDRGLTCLCASLVSSHSAASALGVTMATEVLNIPLGPAPVVALPETLECFCDPKMYGPGSSMYYFENDLPQTFRDHNVQQLLTSRRFFSRPLQYSLFQTQDLKFGPQSFVANESLPTSSHGGFC
ncbi:hypothetical protein GOODEAATRI_019305 [Goodea atripinnis]|uniref:Uncharacterized protein n=1 Tax=Goodea atripinnis TaxID=208336 RepID=A0ABV0MTL2_9TELE